MLMFLCASALAGTVHVDVRVPVEVILDGEIVAQVFRTARLDVDAEPGEHELVLVQNGVPRGYPIEVPNEGRVMVMVGRSGVTTGQELVPEVLLDEVTVEFRTSDKQRVILVLDDQRIRLEPGRPTSLPLARGEHKVSVRSGDGTIVFANGTLDVNGRGELMVQVSEGRAPEVAGPGGSFIAGSR